CTSRPVEGRYLTASQVVVAIHEGEAFGLEWREAESDCVRSSIVSHSQAHIGDARLPFWVRYDASPSFLAFALDESFVREIWQKAFDRAGDFAIRTSIGIEDPVIGWLGALGRRELSIGGAGGRLYLEGLATMLTVHLLRSHGSSERPPIPHRGGVGPATAWLRPCLFAPGVIEELRCVVDRVVVVIGPPLLRTAVDNYLS